MIPLLVGRCFPQRREQAQSQPWIVSAYAGNVYRIDGDVRFKHVGETTWRLLHVGERLKLGDEVLTGDHAYAEWSLNPGSHLEVHAHSQVRVFDTSLDRMHFDIEAGQVFAVVTTLDNGAALVMDTPPALLHITKRGIYRIRVNTENQAEAAVQIGELKLIDGKGKTVKVTTGRRVRLAVIGERKPWAMDMTTAK